MLASTHLLSKDTSTLGDAADAGFGEDNFEMLGFSDFLQEGVKLAERAFERGQTEIWEINTYSQVLYFLGTFADVSACIQALPNA